MSLVRSQASKIWMFFRKISCGASSEIIFRQKNSLKPLIFRFYDSLPFGFEESRELRALIRWVLG